VFEKVHVVLSNFQVITGGREKNPCWILGLSMMMKGDYGRWIGIGETTSARPSITIFILKSNAVEFQKTS
jgi:hypothetical protein